jgi:hypothetical protein
VRDTEWQQVAIEEYRTLRQESLDSISQAQTTLRGGVVALGVLAALSVDVSGSGPLAELVIALAGPAIATATLMQWLLETKRAVRAGTHIAELEQEFQRRFGGDAPLRWERIVRAEFNPRKSFTYHWSVLGTLLVASLPAVALGLFALGTAGEWLWFAGGVVGDALIVSWMLTFLARAYADLVALHRLPEVGRPPPWPFRETSSAETRQ